METVTKDRAARELSSFPAQGWSDMIAAHLAMPGSLFRAERTSAIVFSSDERGVDAAFGVLGHLNMPRGSFPPLPTYAIVIRETGSRQDFLLIDRSRRIVVYAPLSSLHSDNEGAWASISQEIQRAVAEAARNPGQMVLNQRGTLLLI